MGTKRFQINIEGMSCGHCVKTVREALEAIAGVRVEDVEIGHAVVTTVDDVRPSALTDAVDDTGFVVQSVVADP